MGHLGFTNINCAHVFSCRAVPFEHENLRCLTVLAASMSLRNQMMTKLATVPNGFKILFLLMVSVMSIGISFLYEKLPFHHVAIHPLE